MTKTKRTATPKKLIVEIVIAIIVVAIAIAIFISSVFLQQTQYISANLFPLHTFIGFNEYDFYPQIQPNGTACIQYVKVIKTIINYTTQNSSTITTTIYNPSQVKDIYLNSVILASYSVGPNNFIARFIQIQQGKTLLCPDIEKAMP